MPGLISKLSEFIVFGAIAAAIVMNILLITTCEMLTTRIGTLGLFHYSVKADYRDWQATDGCVNIDAEVEDTAFNCARVCSIMGLIFGCAIFFFGGFKQCICNLPCAGLILTISHLGVQIMLSLVWVVHLNKICEQTYCSWGEGATYLLVTQLLYLGAGIFSRCLPEPRYKREKAEKPVEVAEPEPEPAPAAPKAEIEEQPAEA